MSLWKSSQDALNRACPISASITGAQISTGLGSNASWAPTHNGNALLFCKAASLLTTGTAGVLAVHLCDDPVGIWYLVNLTPGNPIQGLEFDLVGSSAHGTTVALDANLYIYPGMYSLIQNAGSEQ